MLEYPGGGEPIAACSILLSMGKHILAIIEGARRTLVLRPEVDYVRPARGDQRSDAAKLTGDAKRVAGDMRRAVLKYGEQADYRQG